MPGIPIWSCSTSRCLAWAARDPAADPRLLRRAGDHADRQGRRLHKVKGSRAWSRRLLTKPFDHLELLARIRAADPPTPCAAAAGHRTPSFHSGRLTIDFAPQEVRLATSRAADRRWSKLLDITSSAIPATFCGMRRFCPKVWGNEYIRRDRLPARLRPSTSPETRRRPRAAPAHPNRERSRVSLRCWEITGFDGNVRPISDQLGPLRRLAPPSQCIYWPMPDTLASCYIKGLRRFATTAFGPCSGVREVLPRAPLKSTICSNGTG